MTLAVLNIPTTAPTARELMERALEPHVLVGMPHLNAHGLSETWLMKELGHRHWLMLAKDMGMENADFRTPDGNPVYAAICATSLRGGRLDVVSANDVLTIRSSIAPVSRTQVSSRHRLHVADMVVADVELLSTFVHRLAEGDNHSIARVDLFGHASRTTSDSSLARSAALMRAAVRQPGACLDAKLQTGSFSFRTSQSQEFNGAGLFYFAEFQALMDRAYEEQSSPRGLPRNTSSREVYFFGNIRGNDRVGVETYAVPNEPLSSRYRVYREDGKTIAYARCSRHRHEGPSSA